MHPGFRGFDRLERNRRKDRSTFNCWLICQGRGQPSCPSPFCTLVPQPTSPQLTRMLKGYLDPFEKYDDCHISNPSLNLCKKPLYSLFDSRHHLRKVKEPTGRMSHFRREQEADRVSGHVWNKFKHSAIASPICCLPCCLKASVTNSELTMACTCAHAVVFIAITTIPDKR